MGCRPGMLSIPIHHHAPVTRAPPPTCVMTKCSSEVLRSVPFTSASFSSVSSLKPAAAPRWVPCAHYMVGACARAQSPECATLLPQQQVCPCAHPPPLSPTLPAHAQPQQQQQPAPAPTHLVQVVAQLQHRLQQLGEGGAALQLAARRPHNLQVLHALQGGGGQARGWCEVVPGRRWLHLAAWRVRTQLERCPSPTALLQLARTLACVAL